MTSSPGPTPSAPSATSSAAVPELVATACSTPRSRAIPVSNARVRGPIVSQPERTASTTARSSSAPNEGRDHGIFRTVVLYDDPYPLTTADARSRGGESYLVGLERQKRRRIERLDAEVGIETRFE